MKKHHKSQDPPRKLSSSRISSRKVHKLSLLPKQTSSLFGLKKNIVMTYSKSRPVQVVKKNHFHTPVTPQVLITPDELQTTGGNQGREMIRNTNPASQGGSYVSGKTLLSLEASSLQMTNKLVTPLELTKDPSKSSIRSIKQGSSLALRNISNIPIEKTLSRTQCTPDRNDVQRIYQDTGPKSLRKSSKKTPISWKGGKGLIRKTKELKKIDENGKDQRNPHQENGKQKITLKTSPTSDKTCSVHSNATNYSTKSMSTCATASSRGASKQGHSGTFTVKSMSLCSTLTNDPNIGPTPVALGSVDKEALLPKNSTFNESGECVMVQEFFPNDHLSSIKEVGTIDEDGTIKKPSSPPVEQVESQKKDTSSCSNKFGNHLNKNAEAQRTSSLMSHQNINSSNTGNNGPKTSTPTDQGKLPATLEVDVSTILEVSNDEKGNSKKNIDTHEEICVKRRIGKVSQRNSLTRCTRDRSVTPDHKTKPENHRATKTTQRQAQDHEENSKMSLPLQASICIEDDSDPEYIQDNVTPEMMEPSKSCPSSSKRKLEYGSALHRHDVNVCFLLDLKCSRKRPCKLWMRKESPCVTSSEQDGVYVPQDILATI